jgi:dynein heavy chain 2
MGMIYFSDETLEVKVLIDSWIFKLPEAQREKLKNFITDFFLKSLDWIKTNIELVVDTTKLGVIMNGLSHLSECSDKRSFLYGKVILILGLVRGFGGNMSLSDRALFATELFSWANETTPDPKRILNYFVNSNLQYEKYSLRPSDPLTDDQIRDIDSLPIIETGDMNRSIDMISPWMAEGKPFLVVGPEGCGKSTLLRYCFSRQPSAAVATIYCNSQTKTKTILQKLFQSCVCTTTIHGRVLRPKEKEKLILYLKDINLPKPDKVLFLKHSSMKQLKLFNFYNSC